MKTEAHRTLLCGSGIATSSNPGVGLLAVLLFLALGSTAVLAQPYAAQNFDARSSLTAPALRAPSNAQAYEVARLRAQLPDLAVTYDDRTGVTRKLSNRVGYLAGPDARTASEIATSYMEARAGLLGLTANDVQDYEVRSVHTNAATGAGHVYLRQMAFGLPLYNGQLHINVNRDGRVLSVNNAFLPDLASSVNTTTPTLTAVEAVQNAADQIGVAASPAAVYTARLMLLPVQRGEARLVWNLQLGTTDGQHHYDFTVDAVTGQVWTRFDWVASQTSGAAGASAAGVPELTVYPIPVESPNHTSPLPPSDGRSVVVDPADSVASPLGWHDDGTTAYTIMRGNNVHAYDDAADADAPPISQPDCGVDLHCNFPIDFTLAPSNSIPAAVANLFYWSNIVHDVQFQYGFDEAAGNFQVDNFGSGGAGSDGVLAEAQDGGGDCNANFLTPPDGFEPRMQMYTCSDTSPARDGDLDNGVIVHEYGHGISNRSVGGPSNVSCLNNDQQMGEGFSDVLALMYTAEVGDAGTDARGIGTYLIGETASGPGIRPARYSTDTGVNGFTYSDIGSQVIPHGVGFVWATAAWEAYWALVDEYGFDPDLYDAAGGSGNQRMMLYVQEGMQNTACSPTFLDARDGIIQAATDNYGGEDVCLLWEAFASRGLGSDATTAGANSLSATDGFDVPLSCIGPDGDVTLQPDPLFCGDSLQLRIGDSDLLGDGTATAGLTASSGDAETISLTEIPAASGIFEAVVATLEAAPIPGNGQLEVASGDTLTATYDDADDGTGSPAVKTASVTANCSDNLGFELGDFTQWGPQDVTSPLVPLQVGGAGISPGFGLFTSAPSEGSLAALHGFDGFPGTIQLGLDVTLPPGATSVDFDYRGGWDLFTYGAVFDRTFRVEIEPSGGGAPLQSDVILVALDDTFVPDTGDLTGSVDVTAFAGQDVRVSFEWDVPELFSGPGFFQLDAVEIVSTAPDGDGDGVPDTLDNCVDDANPGQRDTNQDGYGNLCDADYDDDGIVGGNDFLRLRNAFGSGCGDAAYDADVDADGDCTVGGLDFLTVRSVFGDAPGPSGHACAGTIPCP